MANTSATGGYLVPTSSQPLPGGLTLTQFIQSVLVGLTELAGDLIRPNWQEAPPKEPGLTVNWIAFGINIYNPDIYAYQGLDEQDNDIFARQEGIDVECSFYGPLADDYASKVRDGLQIAQNREALRAANMSFTETTPARPMPDLINERFRRRVMMNIIFRRQIIKTFPVLPVVGAMGTIEVDQDEGNLNIDWRVESEET